MRYCSRKFHHDHFDKKFIADASDLSKDNPFGRIYNDAADAGLIMISYTTGEEATFYVVNEVRDRESEITHWTLQPTTETIRRFPRLIGYTMTILND